MISDKYSIFIILTITIISIMGVSTVLPALPEIEKVFHLNTTEVGLILTVFTLPGVFLAPLAGIIVDKYGRKSVLIPSLLLFGFSGIACAFAPSFHILLLLRIIQGIGLSVPERPGHALLHGAVCRGAEVGGLPQPEAGAGHFSKPALL